MSLRRRIENAIESVFRTLFPWDTTDYAVGKRVYHLHIAMLFWVTTYHAIYFITGSIHPVGWWLLLLFYTLLALQFMILRRCVLSAIEKRNTGIYIDFHGNIMRPFGLENWKVPVIILHYIALVLSLVFEITWVSVPPVKYPM